MSFVQIKTYQHQGLEKKEIFVQAIKTRGLAHLSLTGNIAHTLRDSRDKLKAVVTKASSWGPVDKVLVNVLPVDLPKFSSLLELPIALAIRILLSAEDMTIAAHEKIKNVSFVGSVSLSGEVEGEALNEQGNCIARFQNFEDVWDFVLDRKIFSLEKECLNFYEENEIVEARGREYEKFWLKVAALAKVPVLLMGAPGIGKTYLARWAQSLIEEPRGKLRKEINQIWTLSGKAKFPRIPLQIPHARSHLSEFVGVSRLDVPRPGIFSLAHGGLLVLDEFPELSRDCREILRNIIDEKEVRKNSKAGFLSWPADFWLILTANPCACGMARGDDLSDCRCPESSRLKYIARFSGPLLDRIGMKLFLTKEEKKLPDFLKPSRDKTLNDLPLKHENARQRELFDRLWKAYSCLVEDSKNSRNYFQSFIEEQKSFQSRWLCRV